MKIKFTYLLLSLLPFIFSCRKSPQKNVQPSTDFADHYLLSTINLEIDSSIVILEDYVSFPKEIKSVIAPEGLEYKLIDGGQKLLLLPKERLAPLSLLQLVYKNENLFIPVKKSGKKKFVFSFDPKNEKYKTVQLVGDINAWNPANTPMKYDGQNWQAELVLLPGTYQYQVVADGKWMLDPNNPEKLDNGIGGFNSKLVVVGMDKKQLPKIYTKSFSGNKIIIGNIGDVSGAIALWQNQKCEINRKGNHFEFTVPSEAKKQKRTFVRVVAYNKMGLSNELLIPMEYGSPVNDAAQLTREDKAADILYFLLVDRFNNGTKNNDRPLHDPDVKPRADFYGGDIEGVLKKLEDGYFEELGINTIWLSPIVKNPEGAYGLFDKGGVKSKFSAYHGYWPVSFTKIDERFGSEEAFKKLIKTAHKKNMNVFIDFVANHVHETNPVYQANKENEWATDLYLPDGTLNTERWDEYRLTTWFDVFLPTLNLEKQEVAEMLSDSALYWVEHYDIDGFRHDAAKHIPKSFWRMLTKKIKKYSIGHHKQITQIGETYGTPELINSYINTGMLDGQFDFNVFDALLQTICKKENGFEIVEEKLSQSFDYYGVNNLMGYISGNQDRPRFMALATGDVRFDEDSKLAGWKRDISKKTPEGFAKLEIMNSILLTFPGLPVIFYGDEIGMTGGNDPDCRRMMRFENLSPAENKLKNDVSKIAHLRRNNMAFLFGDFNFLKVEKNVFAFSRKYFDDLGIVIINNSGEDKTVELELPKYFELENMAALYGSEFKIKSNLLSVEMKPFSVEVIKK